MVVHLLAASTNSGGTNLAGLLLPLLLIVGFYFLLIRPQRTKQRAQQALLSSLEVGDDVMTSGGIFGTIIEIDDEEGIVVLEIAPGTRIRMLRQGVSQRFIEDEQQPYEEDEDTDGSVDEETDRQP